MLPSIRGFDRPVPAQENKESPSALDSSNPVKVSDLDQRKEAVFRECEKTIFYLKEATDRLKQSHKDLEKLETQFKIFQERETICKLTISHLEIEVRQIETQIDEHRKALQKSGGRAKKNHVEQQQRLISLKGPKCNFLGQKKKELRLLESALIQLERNWNLQKQILNTFEKEAERWANAAKEATQKYEDLETQSAALGSHLQT